MFCYRDMTFCPFNKDCANANECPRAFTDYHRERATELAMPVSFFTIKPDCHVEALCSTSLLKL